jgi:hypothetical protein
MPHKIKRRHDCKKEGCVSRPISQLICGVRKKEQVIDIPGQPNVEVIYGVLLQCIFCKNVYVQEMTAPKPAEEESKIISG